MATRCGATVSSCGSSVAAFRIDTLEIGSRAKCLKEPKLALIAKSRLRELLEERGLRIEIKGYDKTPSHRALVNIYREDGREIGATLLAEGFAREWRSHHRNAWCDDG
ncbi:nuclease SNase-like protein [Rhizobium phaseoli]|uniref:thermonuclease family protein n=1 Tax=Rhizobium phaseoli TaxID=396 RepID=UPI0007F0904B|nr:nuclease SNase-like protein [Rhizobium phaseoli]